MICKSCERFFHWLQGPPRPVKGEKFREEFRHHRTWESWQKAIAQGCILCTFAQTQFKATIESFLRGNNSEHRELKPTLSWQRYGDRFPSHLLDEEDEMTHGHLISFRLVHTKPGQGKFLIATTISTRLRVTVLIKGMLDRFEIPGYRPTTKTDSEACLNLAKHWLTTCRTQHKSCERPRIRRERKWKPTRLIRVYEDRDILRLFEGDDIPKTVTYATLSHCWGKIENKLVLTLENHDSWRKAIPSFGKLKTFQDAVEIARRLGIWYI